MVKSGQMHFNKSSPGLPPTFFFLLFWGRVSSYCCTVIHTGMNTHCDTSGKQPNKHMWIQRCHTDASWHTVKIAAAWGALHEFLWCSDTKTHMTHSLGLISAPSLWFYSALDVVFHGFATKTLRCTAITVFSGRCIYPHPFIHFDQSWLCLHPNSMFTRHSISRIFTQFITQGFHSCRPLKFINNIGLYGIKDDVQIL